MGGVVAAVPGVEAEQAVERHAPVDGVLELALEIRRGKGFQQHHQATVERIEQIERELKPAQSFSS